MEKYYYAIDGDDIGKYFELYILENNIYEINTLSTNVSNALKKIESYLLYKGAKIIFCAGDSILAYSSNIINIPNKILFYKNLSFSIGIGTSPSLALLALKKAKGLGKKRIVSFLGEAK